MLIGSAFSKLLKLHWYHIIESLMHTVIKINILWTYGGIKKYIAEMGCLALVSQLIRDKMQKCA